MYSQVNVFVYRCKITVWCDCTCELTNYINFQGVPAQPSFGELTPGPNPGEVTIQIKTVASGVDSPSQGFQFNIIPVQNGNEGNVREFPRGNYQSGEFETLVVRELEQGQHYTFSATAMNFYGTSDVQNSASITAGKCVS